MAALSWIAILISLSAVHALVLSQPKGDVDEFTVELLLVVDHSAYLQWHKKTNGTSEVERDENTINSIRRHFAAVVHDMDTLLQDHASRGLHLSVVLTAIKVTSHGAIVEDPSGTIEAAAILRAFLNWTSSDIDLPPHDHAMLITGLKLVNSGGREKGGVAFSAAMCYPSSVSIVKNNFGCFQVVMMAHELGHSLGAKHDGGADRPECPDKRNLMTTSYTAKQEDRWHYSLCSIRDIQGTIEKLTRKRKQCLQKKESNNGPSLGELYNADQMCVLQAGNGSTLCRKWYSGKTYANMCKYLHCQSRQRKNIHRYVCTNSWSPDGLACGDKKMCRLGKCVYKENAETKLDNCPQGDERGIIHSTNFTCAQMVQSDPRLCYNMNYRKSCCESCPKIRKGPANCPYGDKKGLCKKINRKNCSKKYVKVLCCALCA